jgi:uncharacterized protein (DUF433 family)
MIRVWCQKETKAAIARAFDGLIVRVHGVGREGMLPAWANTKTGTKASRVACVQNRADQGGIRHLQVMAQADLLTRTVVNPAIFGGKPIIRAHRLAVEQVLDMLAAGDDIDTIVAGYPWMGRADVLACIEYALACS